MSEGELEGAPERFFGALVRRIRAVNPDYLTEPFTVAEIYQSLVPYREHRNEIGVTMNADYEHTLLRLLAGEGGYLVLDSERAREEIRRELDSPNPDTSVYRDFAAAHVRLDPHRAREVTDPADPAAAGSAPEGPDLPSPEEGARDPSPVAMEGNAGDDGEGDGPIRWEFDAGPEPPTPGVGEPSPFTGGATLPPEMCPGCGEALPRREGVRYCPHCGDDVRVRRCPGCGEELEREWRFCVACGTEVGG